MMSGWMVRQYPGSGHVGDPIIDLAQHGSFREALIDLLGRAARWQGEIPDTRMVTAPKNDHGESEVAILWELGVIHCVLSAERITPRSWCTHCGVDCPHIPTDGPAIT